ncbi:MAG: hypothetical protein ABT15_25500 [Pseudonocardia sp. SCN 73-27]|uniref:lysylphosphatidylglycerol synthase domain-containing protein n=1 Tax=unclassified Pseudonocardia TaxID=2619320 RepID=UPI00086D1925|nr:MULTISPECIES: lysylphosphatidylglycerol synthase domain-containing protein [unclassified Pseudonocardia]ODU26446.1 MAG: hypothetical protein ABS80_06930 [Pseudonocardia sp. SCN 72-51]ODV02247.1 MAG: hypothetical protein ABT15_25500 [Pseudonocardia sp. SCN 73-27]
MVGEDGVDGAPGPASHRGRRRLTQVAGMAAGSITIIPGGLGIVDSALILGLVAAGIATPTAIAAVVLYRIISFGFVIGTGRLIWLLVRRHVAREGAVP